MIAAHGPHSRSSLSRAATPRNSVSCVVVVVVVSIVHRLHKQEDQQRQYHPLTHFVYATVPIDGRTTGSKFPEATPLISSASSVSSRDIDSSSPYKKENCSLHNQDFSLARRRHVAASRRMFFFVLS